MGAPQPLPPLGIHQPMTDRRQPPRPKNRDRAALWPILRAVLALAVVLVLAPAAWQAAEAGKTPRYVSLGSDRVNVRTGPGVRYPVAWRFVRRGLPVEVIAEYELWRKIRDRDGAEGWVHKSLLSGRRTVVVQGKTRTFYKQPGQTMEPAFLAEAGVICRLRYCRGEWCQVQTSGFRGWGLRKDLWGVYPDEDVE